ncbi:MAG: hypothetical protein HQ546_10365 [Planctomycetes bacterium]|nr:hypothetical protein [Planctomycetota bacterium]
MARTRKNTQLFALRNPPPGLLAVRGRRYELAKVFKHDFFAATALYLAGEPGLVPNKLVVKFGREQGFCGLGGHWLGRCLLRRERRFHRRIDDTGAVQRWVAQISETAYALEYVEGRTLDTFERAPGDGGQFFENLRKVVDAIHARGAAYCDMNKRSNIVVTPDGRPVLIDFQISLLYNQLANPLWRWLLRRLVAYMQQMDLYHLYKHKLRLGPGLATAEELASADVRRHGRLIRLHRRLTTPLRRLRRAFLSRQYRSGRLVSPSARLEDHDQPEKATWRK